MSQERDAPHGAAADFVLGVHFLFALFAVIGGFLALLDWRVVFVHVPAVVWSSVVNLANCTCPLTPLEKRLRRQAGQPAFEGGWTSTTSSLWSGRWECRVVWNVIVYGFVFTLVQVDQV